jgi:hypothetical protein
MMLFVLRKFIYHNSRLFKGRRRPQYNIIWWFGNQTLWHWCQSFGQWTSYMYIDLFSVLVVMVTARSSFWRRTFLLLLLPSSFRFGFTVMWYNISEWIITTSLSLTYIAIFIHYFFLTHLVILNIKMFKFGMDTYCFIGFTI